MISAHDPEKLTNLLGLKRFVYISAEAGIVAIQGSASGGEAEKPWKCSAIISTVNTVRI